MDALLIDGSRYSGSGTIVRQAVALSALTGRAVHIINARQRRPKPGLRRQHVRVVEAIRELVGGEAEGAHEGSTELVFRPGHATERREYTWDIGSAGSTTLLALAILPVLAFRSVPAAVELRGGLFQDFAPTYYHLRHVMVHLLQRMGMEAQVWMERPGYVPTGGGILRVTVQPAAQPLKPLAFDEAGTVRNLWGIAMASNLAEARVAARMAEASQEVLMAAGRRAEFELVDDATALQRGAALALFADFADGHRIGADRAGAPGRRSEGIGRRVASQLLAELEAGVTLDAYAGDQVIPFAALASGRTRYRLRSITDHVESGAWLASEFLGARTALEGNTVTIDGVRFRTGTF